MVDERKPCESCGCQMRHAATVAGGTMWIEVEPRDDGNIKLKDQGEDLLPMALVVGRKDSEDPYGSLLELEDTAPRYVNHFGQCPATQEWRERMKAIREGRVNA